MDITVACTMSDRLRGLIGRGNFDGALLLVPCNDIHTFGMRRPIDVAFITSDGTVIESHRAVAPRKRLKNRKAAATLERYSVSDPWFAVGEQIQHIAHASAPTTAA